MVIYNNQSPIIHKKLGKDHHTKVNRFNLLSSIVYFLDEIIYYVKFILIILYVL